MKLSIRNQWHRLLVRAFTLIALSAVTFLPSILVAFAFWLLPETKGREPEDLWPAEGLGP